MATWIHDLDTLQSLAEELGPVGHWARLQRLGRGAPTPLPCSERTAAATLALLPDGLDGWVAEAPGEALWLLETALHHGAAPSTPGAWTASLEPHLAGPHGRYAANILVRLGCFTRAHLRTVLQHDRDDFKLLAWVLASTPPEQLDAVATEVAEGLRDDIEQGCPRILQALQMLTPGHPALGTRNPDDAVKLGAMLADAECRFRPSSGSARSRTNRLLLAVCEGLTTPSAALGRALARLRKSPALDSTVLAALSWEKHYEPADPYTNVTQRSSRSPAEIRTARLAVRAGSPVALPADEPALVGLLIERSTEHPDEVARLLSGPPATPQQAAAHTGLILLHPDRTPPMLIQPETRDYGIFMAILTPTVEVLRLLLTLPIPAKPEVRSNLARALVSTGDRAALPNIRAIIGHLEPDEVSEIRELARSIFNQEL